MKTTYPLRPLAEALRLNRDEVTVEPNTEYRIAGMYSFGKGLFERASVTGSDIRYRSLFRLHAETLVMSRLNGWEGAVTLVDGAGEGCFVSNEYPTFSINTDRAITSYLGHLCRWPSFWESLRDRARGIGSDVGVRRLRVHPNDLLATEVPLPDLDEQRRVAAILDGALTQARSVERAIGGRPPLLSLLPRLLEGVLDGAIERPLGAVVTFVSDTLHSSEASQQGLDFVGLEHLEPHTGRAIGSSDPGDADGPKKVFEKGDILYPRLRPYQNKVWLADRRGVCSSDQLVLRPVDPTSAPAVAIILRCQHVLDQVAAMTSRLQLPRIRQAEFTTTRIRIPAPPSRFTAAARLITERMRDAAVLEEGQAVLAAAYFPSALNTAFGGSAERTRAH